MSIVFIPKIPDHLRKTASRVDAFSKEEIEQCIQLRAAGVPYKECAKIMSRPQGSVSNAVTYYDLHGAIAEAKELLKSPCVGVCKLDDNHVCTGCGRTIEQITNHPKCMGL